MIELKPRDGSHERDPDGVRIIPRNGGASRRTGILQGVALLLVASFAGYMLMPRSVTSSQARADGTDRSVVGAAPPEVVAANAGSAAGVPAATVDTGAVATPAVPSTRSVTPRRTATQRPAPETEEEEGELPIPKEMLKDVTAAEYIKALNDAGIYEGIGAFPPPGTSPPIEGLAVPPDYELPEGYVRHFQTTDDGQAIDPILMYSPDYEFLDSNGNPVAIPEDRVVPLEHAPPGMPVRQIELPKPREPGDLSR